jgi:hypothetical protein
LTEEELAPHYFVPNFLRPLPVEELPSGGDTLDEDLEVSIDTL